LTHFWKFSEHLQAVWLKVCGSIFGVSGKVILAGIYLNPQSSARTNADIAETFSYLHLDISEAQANCSHLFLLGDFNAHLTNSPDFFPDHASLLDTFPQLGQNRLGHYPSPNLAGECLSDIAAQTPLILTTGRGKGDSGQPSFLGFNTNITIPSRTEHLAMSPSLYHNCHNVHVDDDTDCSDHRPLICGFSSVDIPNIDLRLPQHTVRQERGEKLIWRAELQNTYVTDLMENDQILQLRENIGNKDAESAYTTFVSLIQTAAEKAGMTVRQRPRRVRLGLPVAPWFDDTCRAMKAQIRWLIRHRQPTAELKRQYVSHCKTLSKIYDKQRAQDMVNSVDGSKEAVYKYMKGKKNAATTPILATSWTQHLQHHFRQPPDPVSSHVPRLPPRDQLLSDQLRSRQVLPSEIAVPPGPGGRYRQMAAEHSNDNGLPQLPPPPRYDLPSADTLHTYVQKNVSKMNTDSSPGFDPFATPFIKKAERYFRNDRGKLQTENVLIKHLADLFHLLLFCGVLPQAWKKTKITPLHKKGSLTDPTNYRLLAINGCVYRLFSNVVRDLLTEWALAEKHVPDTQFGFCPTRNTNQPLFIIRHVLTTAKKNKKKVFAAFLDLLSAYDSVSRERLWTHLQKLGTPQYILNTIRAMYQGGIYILIDGDKCSEEVSPDRGLKQGCPLSPLLYSLFTNDIDRFLDVYEYGAMTAIETTKVPHCDYADDIVNLSNEARHLQSQLDRFFIYTQQKGLTLNAGKTKILVFFSNDQSNIPTFYYNGVALETVTEFKYLGVILTRDGKLKTATNQMARNFMGAIARVRKAGTELGIWNRKHAMLWLFQVFALSAGLYGCQIWATSKLSFLASKETAAHSYHTGFLKSLLGVKRATETHCILRETGQLPLFFYWFRCIMRFWNCLLDANNPLVQKVVQADLRLASRKGSWTYDILTALNHMPDSQPFTTAVHNLQRVDIPRFETILHQYITNDWRVLDGLTPQEPHHTSRIMRTYHTHFGIPLGSSPRWWDEQNRSRKPVLPHYLRQDIPHKQLRSLSCLRLSGHSLRVEALRHHPNRCAYELRICDKCDWHTVQDEEHIILDCPNEYLTNLRTEFQRLFVNSSANSSTRLRDFCNQTDACGVASFVHKCLNFCA